MKELLFSWFTNLGQKLVVLLLVGTTAVTTGSAVSKLVAAPKVLGARAETVSPTPEVTGNQPSPTPTRVAPTTSPTTKTLPTATPTARSNQTVAASVNLSGRCIITLFGKQYDVTTLRTTHSGGDIFSCGSDMTSSYQAKHGTNMSRMARYEVTGTGQTSVNGGTLVSNGGSEDEGEGEDEDEEEIEREDREYESRYVEREEREEVENED